MVDLIAIVGPTAAGKTSLGAEIAARAGGEVVSADAFAVYRGLDIGTAKPEPEVRERVPHHLIDVADPRERYSAGAFIRDADAVIAGIRERGRLPVIVGGTLFYVRALLYGLFPEPPKDPAVRLALEEAWRADPAAVRARLVALDPASGVRIAAADRQRTLRALEVALVSGRPMSELWREHPVASERYRFAMLGVTPERSRLHVRIAQRVEMMFAAGLVEEVQALLGRGVSAESHAFKAIGYRECARAVQGEWSIEQAREATVAATRRLAKRQLTWLRGDSRVEWLRAEGEDAVTRALRRLEAGGGTGTGSGQ